MNKSEKTNAGGAIVAGLVAGWLAVAVTKSTVAFWVVAAVAAFLWWSASTSN